MANDSRGPDAAGGGPAEQAWPNAGTQPAFEGYRWFGSASQQWAPPTAPPAPQLDAARAVPPAAPGAVADAPHVHDQHREGPGGPSWGGPYNAGPPAAPSGPSHDSRAAFPPPHPGGWWPREPYQGPMAGAPSGPPRRPGRGGLVALGAAAVLLAGVVGGVVGHALADGGGGSRGVLGEPLPDITAVEAPTGAVEAVAARG